MKRSDLESKVQITWEPGEIINGEQVPFDRCVGRLELNASGYLAACLHEDGPARRELERAVRKSLVSALMGDRDTENQRLRAALKKWGRRFNSLHAACVHGGPSCEGYEKELEEDLA